MIEIYENLLVFLEKTEGKSRRGQKMFDSISMDMNLNKFQETVKDRGAWSAYSQRGRNELDTTEWLNNNKILNHLENIKINLKIHLN